MKREVKTCLLMAVFLCAAMSYSVFITVPVHAFPAWLVQVWINVPAKVEVLSDSNVIYSYDSVGYAKFDLETGTYTFRISKTGYDTYQETMEINGHTNLWVELKDGIKPQVQSMVAIPNPVMVGNFVNIIVVFREEGTGLDYSKEPMVKLRTQGGQEVILTKVSYANNKWRGEAAVPDDEGVATVNVGGARDKAGNTMDVTNAGTFTIVAATGGWPLWTVNPDGTKNAETGTITDIFAAGRGAPVDEFHEGVDIIAPENTAVFPVAGGRVTAIHHNVDTFGNQIVEVTTATGQVHWYGHVKNPPAGLLNKEVNINDKIAEVGHWNPASKAHLHFDLDRRNHNPLMPNGPLKDKDTPGLPTVSDDKIFPWKDDHTPPADGDVEEPSRVFIRGKIDIVCQAFDPSTPHNAGVMQLMWKVNEGGRLKYIIRDGRWDDRLNNALAERLFKEQPPADTEQAKQYFYIITNTNNPDIGGRNDLTREGYWNTKLKAGLAEQWNGDDAGSNAEAQYPDGHHLIWIRAGSDIETDLGEWATYKVNINNFNQTVESSNSEGGRTDVFFQDETIYIVGEGYLPNTEYIVYIFPDQHWTKDETLPPPSPLLPPTDITWATVRTDFEGRIPPTEIAGPWHLPEGKYDIVIDYDKDEKYSIPRFNIAVDGLDDNDVDYTAGFIVKTRPPPPPEWYWKPAYHDYAQAGMPDFGQRQPPDPFYGGAYMQDWRDAQGQWSYCGPVATANSLWWLDSRFEPPIMKPPVMADLFSLVGAYGPWDDHDPRNVPPFVEDLAWWMDTNGIRTGHPHKGTYVWDMEWGIELYQRYRGHFADFWELTLEKPTFEQVERLIWKSEDVILLLGFWQLRDGVWRRFGGHYVTVAGINSIDRIISISDPYFDSAETGRTPGHVDGAPSPFNPLHMPHPEGDAFHNDASTVSHDMYPAVPSQSPGGNWALAYYPYSNVTFPGNYSILANFEHQNFADEMQNLEYYAPFDLKLPVFTEVEYAVVKSPLYPKELDLEPPRLLNLTRPVSTEWLELYPHYGQRYLLENWSDINRNNILDPSDYIDLWDMDLERKAMPYWWYVDDVTVTLKVTKKPYLTETMYIEFEVGWPEYDHVITQPTCTQWLEKYPVYGNQYHLEKWFDNCDNRLSPSDQIILHNKLTSERAEYHVDEVKTNIIISPRVTQIIPSKTKDYIGQGYPQIMPITIENYYANTTVFTVSAYYDGFQPIGNQTITLNPLESGNAIIKWTETATWLKATYHHIITINTYANNTLVYTITFPIIFQITIVGDVNGDGKVDIKDIATAAIAFGSYLNHPRWNPNSDINNDLKIDIRDLAAIAKNFGKTDP